MNKDDILAKSRKENNSEYEKDVSTKAVTKSVFVLTAICIFFWFTKVVYSDIKGLEKALPAYEFPAILFAYTSSCYLYIYYKLKNKINLVIGLGFLILFIIFLCKYFLSI